MITCISFNIEGLNRNIQSLKYFVDMLSPSLVFLTEPQVYDCDVSSVFQPMKATHRFHLNSEDAFNDSLALEKSKAKGGTMIVWSLSIDPYVTILPTTTPAILPCRLQLPGLVASYHFCIYLPTAGKNDEFVSTLAELSDMIGEIYENSDGEAPVFIRGDANASTRNAPRTELMNHFLNKHDLHRVKIPHKTYHHFTGGGAFDSDLDVLIHTNQEGVSEKFSQLFCQLEHPLVESHHDLIVSTFSLPPAPPPKQKSHGNISAPRIANDRVKTIWSDEGVTAYRNLSQS